MKIKQPTDIYPSSLRLPRPLNHDEKFCEIPLSPAVYTGAAVDNVIISEYIYIL